MKINKHYIWWAIFAIVYAGLTIALPPNANTLVKYQLTGSQARLLSLSFVLPYIAIWLAAFYGYVQCRDYANLIHKKKDGKAFSVIGKGLMYLALGLPISAITSNLMNQLVARQPHLLATTTIINNYVGLMVVLIAFFTISQGTRMLASTVKSLRPNNHQVLLLGLYIIFGAVYAYVTISNPARQFHTADSTRAAYYLPDTLLLFTIVVPYLLVWFWGFQSAYEIHVYKKRVSGVIYKDSLGLLAKGIVAVVVAFALIRFLVSLTTLLNTAKLKTILAILYLFIFIVGIGYIMIAIGAKRMKKIEQV